MLGQKRPWTQDDFHCVDLINLFSIATLSNPPETTRGDCIRRLIKQQSKTVEGKASQTMIYFSDINENIFRVQSKFILIFNHAITKSKQLLSKAEPQTSKQAIFVKVFYLFLFYLFKHICYCFPQKHQGFSKEITISQSIFTSFIHAHIETTDKNCTDELSLYI